MTTRSSSSNLRVPMFVSVCMRGGWIGSYVPDSIKSEIRAGVPAPIPMLKLLVSYMGERHWVDIPCSLQKLLSVLEFDMFREELSNSRLFVLQWAKCSIQY